MLSSRPVLALSICLASVACSFPGVRPEGSTNTATGHAPAAPGAVNDRARQWFTRFGYTITLDRAHAISGHRTIARDGSVDTEAFVEFTIVGGSETATQFRVFTYSRQQPAGAAAVRPVTEPPLPDWLGCPTARWPACP